MKTRTHDKAGQMVRMIAKKIFLGSGAGFLVLSLGGCFINRAMEVQDQFCDFDSNFSFQFAESTNFNIHRPVLLDSDILWIAGAPPSEMIETTEGMLMAFVLEKAGPDTVPGDEIRVELKFDHIDNMYKLKSVRFDPKLNAIINPDFFDKKAIDTAAQTMCETGWSFASTRVEVDISEQDLDEFPNRLEVLDWLGPPLEQNDKDRSLTYEYRLKGNKKKPMMARFTVWFDEAGEKPARMESEYSRFRTSADFNTRKMWVKLKI